MIFKDIQEVDKKLQFEILEWRNHIDIRKNMYTDTLISIETHNKWLNSLRTDESTKVFVAYRENNPIGIVSLTNINFLHKSTDWAFYLNPTFLQSKGLGVLLEYSFLNFIFENFNIEKLNCEVIEINQTVIKLHKKFFFQEEGILRKNIIKNNKRMDVYLLGILNEEWYKSRDKFKKIVTRLKNEDR
jgi:UDP-4-amino-4,6-dideoxy-N-acetyl-beta-L-altrosamine N-acetyltransferase